MARIRSNEKRPVHNAWTSEGKTAQTWRVNSNNSAITACPPPLPPPRVSAKSSRASHLKQSCERYVRETKRESQERDRRATRRERQEREIPRKSVWHDKIMCDMTHGMARRSSERCCCKQLQSRARAINTPRVLLTNVQAHELAASALIISDARRCRVCRACAVVHALPLISDSDWCRRLQVRLTGVDTLQSLPYMHAVDRCRHLAVRYTGTPLHADSMLQIVC